MKRTAIALSLWALSCLSAFAEDTPTKYTLASLVETALRSDLLAATKARIEESRFAAAQTRKWPGVSLDLSAGRKQEASDSGPRYEVGLAQPLPLLGKSGLRGQQLDLATESGQIRHVGSENEVTLNVIHSAYEYTLNRRKAEFVEDRQKRFALIQSYMAGRVFATPQQKAERRIVQNHLIAIEAQALQSQAAVKVPLEELKVYVPFETGNIPDIQVSWLTGQKNLNQAEQIADAMKSNSDLHLQALSVRSAELEKSLATREAWPDPSLIGSYEQAKAADTEKNIGIGLSLTLPSWNGNRGGIRSAEQKRLAEERLLGFQRQKLTAELSQALIEYEAARQTVKQYPREHLTEIQAQLREAEEGFRKGQVDLLTFLELDASAAEAFDKVLESQLALISKIADIFRLNGGRDILTQLESF